jgi:hypothetical protein
VAWALVMLVTAYTVWREVLPVAVSPAADLDGLVGAGEVQVADVRGLHGAGLGTAVPPVKWLVSLCPSSTTR